MQPAPCPNENVLLAFARGGLSGSGSALERVERHLDGCADCRALVAEAARASSASDARSTTAKGPRQGEAPLTRLTELGRYVVLAHLGEGGMGIVYLAYDPDLDRKVALKVLRDSTGVEDEGRLLHEARATARLSHPNVVPVFDVGVASGRVFVTMELIEGQTFRSWCEERPRG